MVEIMGTIGSTPTSRPVQDAMSPNSQKYPKAGLQNIRVWTVWIVFVVVCLLSIIA